MTEFSSNSDLYNYLLRFVEELEQAKDLEAVKKLRFAAAQVTSSSSTEFLGEPLIALRWIREMRSDAMHDPQRKRLDDAIRQLESAFRAKKP